MSRLLHDTPASRVLDDDDRLDEREILARDEVLVRSLQEGDLGRVVRIDERITDRHRLAYYERKFSEALREVRSPNLAGRRDRRAGSGLRDGTGRLR